MTNTSLSDGNERLLNIAGVDDSPISVAASQAAIVGCALCMEDGFDMILLATDPASSSRVSAPTPSRAASPRVAFGPILTDQVLQQAVQKALEQAAADLGTTVSHIVERLTRPAEGQHRPASSGATPAPKQMRDMHEAARRGISVEQLRELRRAEAAENVRLNAMAKAKGITVKELRRQIGRV